MSDEFWVSRGESGYGSVVPGTGLPGALAQILSTPGLVAAYFPYMDVVGRNVLPVGAENFSSGWSTSQCNVSVTAGQADPAGGTSAYKIVVTPTADSTALLYRRFGFAPGIECTYGIWIKTSASGVVVDHENPIGINKAVVSNDEWQHISFTTTPSFSTNGLRAIKKTDAQNGVPFTVYLYAPQNNLGSTLYPYTPPAGLSQILTDRSGQGNHAQLGSTSGVDSNDPAWGDNALVFGGDDYVVGPAINLSTSLTRLLVFKSSSVIDATQVLLGGSSSEQIPGLYLSSLEQIRIGWSQPANATHAISTLSANTWYSVVSVLSQSAVFGVVNGVVSDVHVPTGTVGVQGLNFIGKSGYAVSPGYVANGVQIAFAGHINRAFGISEAVRVERCVRSLMASRGVTLA